MDAIEPAAPSAFELVVLDPSGRIRFSDARACSWLAQGTTVCNAHGGIAAADRATREGFDRLIRRTLEAGAAHHEPAMPRVIPLPRPGRLPLIAVGLPITGGAAHALGAAVLLRDPEVVDLPPLAVVCEIFGLTRAEGAIALAVGNGHALKQIAESRRCSVNTVRTLLGRAFAKTGCRRQADLVRVMGALAELRAAADGFSAGHAMASLHDKALRRASESRVRALLQLPLRAPPNQQARIVSRDFSPGEATGFHVHGCGHEIVCVLDGALTMEYAGAGAGQTIAGEAVYVAPGVVHQGRNLDTLHSLSLYHVGIGPAGSIDRRNL
ncbi:hypothetical protein QTH97_20135 [Variovorax sp. J22R24]|uniref:hypothetical protein n=1 Tax=Variovorax gracilis TaxID=3053502 RepID=UPI002575D336|nr:hypothetical protein [Variovorax sp. J22R24]MDM0107265.1 hypothetical protein [Variovorax sp. J22R24]